MPRNRGFGLVEDVIPTGTLETARKRIQSHIDNLRLMEYNIQQLAVNCYLQGSRDMTETILKRPELVQPLPQALDYVI